MENKKKKVYDAPQLTVVSFKAERGFATSGGLFDFEQLMLWENSQPGQRQMENYIVANDWNENSTGFWD